MNLVFSVRDVQELEFVNIWMYCFDRNVWRSCLKAIILKIDIKTLTMAAFELKSGFKNLQNQKHNKKSAYLFEI